MKKSFAASSTSSAAKTAASKVGRGDDRPWLPQEDGGVLARRLADRLRMSARPGRI
jgi:hypothetical protein